MDNEKGKIVFENGSEISILNDNNSIRGISSKNLIFDKNILNINTKIEGDRVMEDIFENLKSLSIEFHEKFKGSCGVECSQCRLSDTLHMVSLHDKDIDLCDILNGIYEKYND